MSPAQKKKKVLAKVMRFRKKLHQTKDMPGLLNFFQETGFVDEAGVPTDLGRDALNK